FTVYFIENVSHMVFGGATESPGVAIAIFFGGLFGVVVFHIAATMLTRRYPEQFQRLSTAILEPVIRRLLGGLYSRQAYRPVDRSPAFRVNGYPPVSAEYTMLARNQWAEWRLEIVGLVEQPLRLSLADLRALPAMRQTTKHNCIQGWSGVAEWAGVPVAVILDLCRPRSEAKWIVFHAFEQAEYSPRSYYEALTLAEARQPQSILAYDMNGQPLPAQYGAPCRLRIESKLGYKMVKYLRAIEIVDDLRHVGRAMGGYREDYQYYEKVAAI
ncbi:MAG TPA: molybdopterin-dependent oxidoreductase, partial [Nitrospirales bacterium]|nr:molybdopterin-dependent oxidoreductase [Nitrospirales bacterium]